MTGRLLAYAQLLRLPNVFSAFADILMAGLAGGILFNWFNTLILMASSGCLYLAGMIFNDIFDRHDDAKVRAFRPIPSGRVTVRSAVILGSVLLLMGITIPLFTTMFDGKSEFFNNPVWIAILLAFAILFYDVWLKRTPWGPLGMGLCRFLNVLLGLTAGLPIESSFAIYLASIVGIYIVGVTWFARTEEGTSQRWHLLAASAVMAVAWLMALALPMYLQNSSPIYPYGLIAFGFAVGIPITKAIRSPKPQHVQAAVKRCIFGLILFDAALATAFVGWPGLLIGLLLIPAIWLGKKVYST